MDNQILEVVHTKIINQIYEQRMQPGEKHLLTPNMRNWKMLTMDQVRMLNYRWLADRSIRESHLKHQLSDEEMNWGNLDYLTKYDSTIVNREMISGMMFKRIQGTEIECRQKTEFKSD